MRLEDLLVEEGVAVPVERIRRVLDEAERSGRHAVVALVEEGVIVEDVLAEVLARACGTVVVDLGRDQDLEVAQLITQALAAECLVLPVSIQPGGKVRVAMANPLDQDARRLVEDEIGMQVQPLVGTLSGLREAIAIAFSVGNTRVVRGRRTDIPAENTRRMLAPSTDTSPLHRLEEDATMEQRHEALLLALVERGLVTRADYKDALKRLLSGRRDEE